MQEIFEEQMADAYDQGALDMVRAQISEAVMFATGMVPGAGEGGVPTPAENDANVGGTGNGTNAQPLAPPKPDAQAKEMINKIVTLAYGTKLAQRRNPEPDE